MVKRNLQARRKWKWNYVLKHLRFCKSLSWLTFRSSHQLKQHGPPPFIMMLDTWHRASGIGSLSSAIASLPSNTEVTAIGRSSVRLCTTPYIKSFVSWFLKPSLWGYQFHHFRISWLWFLLTNGQIAIGLAAAGVPVLQLKGAIAITVAMPRHHCTQV